MFNDNNTRGHAFKIQEPILHFPLVLMNRLNETESAVFLYFRFSLLLKDPFFQII